ncbi:MAG: polysaccharide biosynthesis C-terminal domain-containing protein [Patescibacteria group bacterium]|nr:polysaccharide biosynthesis C-terminal domain-containing protein [Patescibacteria group bacterium]
MCITAGALFFAFMTGTLTTVLQVQMKMQRAAGPLVIGKIISTGYLAYSILHEFSFEHLLLAGLIGNIFVFALTYYYAAQESVIRVEFDKEYWMHVVRTALPYGLALILSTIYFRIDSIMLFEMRGADEVGIYGVPMRILEIVNIIPIIFLNTVLPAMTQFAQQENKEKLSSMMQKSWDILVFLSFPLAAGSIALALPLILFVSSPEFAPSVDPMRILMFAMIFSFLNSVFAFILVALGRQAKMLYVNGVVVIFNVVANYFAITHYGYMGAAVTSVLSEFFVLAANAAIVYYYFPFVFSWLRTAKIFISSVCM